MGRVQRVGDLDNQIQGLLQRQRLALDAMFRYPAIQKLHGSEGTAILLANVVSCADVRVVQRGSSLSRTLKSSCRARIPSDAWRKEFQSHEAMLARVFGLVDHTHAATARLFVYAAVRNGLPE